MILSKLPVKVAKYVNTEMVLKYWVMDKVLCKNISPFSNEIIKSIVKCINAIRANVKNENISIYLKAILRR